VKKQIFTLLHNVPFIFHFRVRAELFQNMLLLIRRNNEVHAALHV
jgi:hypothetical protein